MSSASDMRLGRRYELAERVGAGGFSEVWRAADSVLGRPVAIKLLHPGYAQHAETLARFRAEARHASRLSHENIARVYDFGEADPSFSFSPFLVMELVDGPSLAEVLAEGPMDLARSIDILAQTAAGLDAAHRAGLVHRDVKPANLLLGPGGVVKITDFGISHAADSAPVTSTGMLVGTPGYLAPERVAGERATSASDLYALGVVAYECLAGAPPFTGGAIAVALAHRDRPLPELPASVPAEVAMLISELTDKDPAARPGSAGEVAGRAAELAARFTGDAGAQLTHVDRHAAPQARQPTLGLMTVPAPPARWRGRRPGRAAALAAAAIVAAVAGLILASVIGPAPPQRASAIPSSSSLPKSQAALTVEVSSGSLVGQPVSVAARRLRQQGLKVRLIWQRSEQQPPGRVVAIRPAGRRPLGSLVTVVGALQPGSNGAQPAGQDQSPGTGTGTGSGNGHGAGHGQGKAKGKGKEKTHGKGSS